MTRETSKDDPNKTPNFVEYWPLHYYLKEFYALSGHHRDYFLKIQFCDIENLEN
jgi:hypothetical protein